MDTAVRMRRKVQPKPLVRASHPPLSPGEVRQGMRISLWESAVANIHISITGSIGGSVFLSGFALLLGANSFQLGLIGALPFIGQLFQFVGAYLEERVGDRRKLVLQGALAGRLIWILLLVLPFLTFLNGSQLLIFFIGLAFSYAFNGIAGNAWLSWMSDLVPANRRGSYFGVRNTVGAIAAMAATFLAGWALDLTRDHGQESLGYAIIFGVAVVAALGAAALIKRQAEPPLTPKPQVNLRDMLVGPLQDRHFRSYVWANLGWAVATGIASPFFNAYGLSVLNLSFSLLAVQAIATSAVSLVFGPLMGRLQDRYGARRVLVACVIGTLPLPWGWVFATPEYVLPLWLTAIFAGVFWPGINQGLVNVLMDRAPENYRGASMAAFSAITGIGTLLAGVLGGMLAMLLSNTQVMIGSVPIMGMGFLFVLSSVLRAVMVGVFWKTL
ncbi:MFS transporter [Candidatus Oscillochloris fontis]|uniref:MFS transporter n=1 Tax=Candidatus Oscillochloris fontis TaxID=2496868 RepID=UPI00101D885C|nr:MFS transporter [Candidatus Oscillochloris fontis]